MFELQLELHAMATGAAAAISADEVIEVGCLLASHAGDLKSLISER